MCVCMRKKKRKDPSGYIRHLTARSRSTISNWCRRLQAVYERARARRFIHTQQYIFLLFVCTSSRIYISMFVCKNSGSNHTKKTLMTNCWPLILHNSECQWHIYIRTHCSREKEFGKADEWYDNMEMCIRKSAKKKKRNQINRKRIL